MTGGEWTAVLRRLVSHLLPLAFVVAQPLRAQEAPERLDRGRFTFVFFPRDRQLATSLASHAVATDSFPGLPRPGDRVLVAIAPDYRRFRAWVGGAAPEWGAAVAFPESRRIVLQGQGARGDAGDPMDVLRHELAHLALHEQLGDLPSRWFDEGYASYAAGEWGREDVLMTNLALAFRGMPTLDELDASFEGGANAAQSAYAMAHRAVAELAETGGNAGLALFFRYWKDSRSFERAMRQAFGITSAEFERRWRQHTRAQYGVLALVSNIALAGLLLLFVLTPLYIARRRRDLKRLERMREADAEAERAQPTSIDEMLRPEPPDRPPAA